MVMVALVFLFIKKYNLWPCDEQMEEEWNQTSLDLQLAREQVGDLSLKVTVLTAGKNQHR